MSATPESEQAASRGPDTLHRDATPAARKEEPAPRGELVRRAIAIAVWLALFLGLVPLGNRVVPDETKAHVSLQTFLMTCQILTLVLGVGVTLLVLKRRREGLGLTDLPRAHSLASAFLSVPLVFVASSWIALQIALPTLMEELRTRGAGASQQNAGEFGRALTQAPLLTTLIWGALLGALGEELFFRGLLWTTITDLTKRLLPPIEVEAPRTFGRRALEVLLDGAVATLVCAALFGWMHKDLPGGVGIVRVVSTTCLGLASGMVRQATRGVLACIGLHAAYNALVIGAGRKWFASREEPVLTGVPNALLLAAIVGVLAIGIVAFARALSARRARDPFAMD
ncbi:MAG: CPBP family intramembrane glutamic endopeptidase [Polyangiaceae bacterium]